MRYFRKEVFYIINKTEIQLQDLICREVNKNKSTALEVLDQTVYAEVAKNFNINSPQKAFEVIRLIEMNYKILTN